MKTWADFYTFYLADLPGCTSFAAANELRRAAQEFCGRTRVWRVDLDPTITNAKEDTYEFELEDDWLLCKVLAAKLDDADLNILTPSDDLRGATGILPLDQTQFTLFPQPGAKQRVYITAALKPSNEADGVEDYVFDHYAEKIAYGAKARLMMRPNKPYSDPAMAERFEEKFEQAIADATWNAAKAYSQAPLRTRAKFF